MQLVVLGTDEQWNELITSTPAHLEWKRATLPFSFNTHLTADAFFLLDEAANINFSETQKPVFVNAVVATAVKKKLPAHVLRINGWATFLQRPLWEIAGNNVSESINEDAATILSQMEKKHLLISDIPGFIAARVIAMIINEAYFAIGADVSNKTNIDTAMKLGTNYPYGPFEWTEKIGLKNIYLLLLELSTTDKRCIPAPALVKEAAPLII